MKNLVIPSFAISLAITSYLTLKAPSIELLIPIILLLIGAAIIAKNFREVIK